jgi:hypothetical protein
VVLVLALGAEAIHQHLEGRPPGPWRRLAWAAGPAVGLGGYLLFWQVFAGDWLAPFHQQANWQREASVPLLTVVLGTLRGFEFPGVFPGGYHMLDWLVVIPALAAAVWVAMRTRPLFGVYTWASILVPLTFIFPPRPFMSLPRFLLVVFPILWAPAVLSRRRPLVHGTWVGVSGVLLGVLTLLFVNWYYVF